MTRATQTRIIARHGYAYDWSAQMVRMTMPLPPFEIPDGPDETAPRQPMIRGDFEWKQDPVLRDADRMLK